MCEAIYIRIVHSKLSHSLPTRSSAPFKGAKVLERMPYAEYVLKSIEVWPIAGENVVVGAGWSMSHERRSYVCVYIVQISDEQVLEIPHNILVLYISDLSLQNRVGGASSVHDELV